MIPSIPVALFFILSLNNTAFGDSIDLYTWRTIPLGGGGYVTGMVFHPQERNLAYIRTDVGGAYRWDAAEDRMIPITDWIRYDESNLYGIDGIAIAPNNPDILYMVCGKYPNASPHAILKSADRGKAWTKIDLNQPANANGNLRWAGECIAADPVNENIVYYGTRNKGLFKVDLSINTSNLVSKNLGKDGAIRAILFDPSSSQDNKTNIIYIGVYGKGIYQTTNAGEDWVLMDGSPKEPLRMAISPSPQPSPKGRGSTSTEFSSYPGVRSNTIQAEEEKNKQSSVLFVTTPRGVFRYSENQWQDISPEKDKEYCGISVNPSNPKMVVCAQRFRGFNNPIYLSLDQGNTWSNVLEKCEIHFQAPWWPKNHFSAATACIVFNPHAKNEVWFTDWYGTWHTPDITAIPCHWHTHENGHEEMVVFGIISPPAGAPLLTAIADNNGTRHANLDDYPDSIYQNPWVQSTTGLDFCEADPNCIVRVGSRNDGSDGAGAFSTDNGVSWKPFGKTNFAMNGRIAVSAKDPNRIVVLPMADSPKYSRDKGKTWNESEGAPKGGIGNFWHKSQPLASDRADGNLFYYFEGGILYHSNDGGKTWEKGALLPRDQKGFLVNVKCVPGKEGEVWVSLGKNGLFRSQDKGNTFNKVENVSWAHLFDFGKPAPGNDNPALFLYGTTNNATGVFRSADMGNTWVRINDDQNQIGDSPECLTADRQVFGRVYIGTNGRGIFVGERK